MQAALGPTEHSSVLCVHRLRSCTSNLCKQAFLMTAMQLWWCGALLALPMDERSTCPAMHSAQCMHAQVTTAACHRQQPLARWRPQAGMQQSCLASVGVMLQVLGSRAPCKRMCSMPGACRQVPTWQWSVKVRATPLRGPLATSHHGMRRLPTLLRATGNGRSMNVPCD